MEIPVYMSVAGRGDCASATLAVSAAKFCRGPRGCFLWRSLGYDHSHHSDGLRAVLGIAVRRNAACDSCRPGGR